MSISVVIPTYNSEDFINETLRSVEAQTLLPKEVIIVDDGSSDHTVKVVTDYAKDSKLIIRVLQNDRKKGPSGTRNFGVLNATSEFIAFLDSDDIWLPRHLEQLATYLDRFLTADIAFSGVDFFGEASGIVKYSENSRNLVVKVLNKSFLKKDLNVWLSRESLLKTSLSDGVPFRVQASLVRTQVFYDKKIWFDENVPVTQDGLFFMMAAAYAQFIDVDEVGVRIRRRCDDDEVWYGMKIADSSDAIVVRLKEFFKCQQLDTDTRAAVRFCLIEHQYEAMSIRARNGSIFLCIQEAVKFVVRLPGRESIQMAIKTLGKRILASLKIKKTKQ